MTRVSSLGASNMMVRQILDIQKKMFGLEVQVGTQKASQDYTGIAGQSEYMINMENLRSTIEKYRTNNNNERVRQDISSSALEGAKDVMEQFKRGLRKFSKGGPTDKENIATLQKLAFKSLQLLEASMNTQGDGRYLYSGSRVHTEPVDLGLSRLAAFQEKFDGALVRYPETRGQNLSNISQSESRNGADNFIQFQRDNGDNPPRSRMILDDAAAAAEYTVGSVITITDAQDAENNGTWRIAAVNGRNIDLETEMFTDDADTGAKIEFTAGVGDPGTVKLTGATFARSDGGDPERSTMTGNAGDYSTLRAGQTFTVANAADPSNNGDFTVQSVSADGSTVTIETKMMADSADTFSFDANPAAPVTFADGAAGADDTLSFTAPPGFDINDIEVGGQITVAGGAAANNGEHRVTNVTLNAATNIVTVSVQGLDGSDAGFAADVSTAATLRMPASSGTVTANGYYKGDGVARTHRLDDIRTYENDITAMHPAFEKAVRAMSIIAQGKYGTEGGLDQNNPRVKDAMYLINSALDVVVEGVPPPYGEEETGSIQALQEDVGYNQVMLNNLEKKHKDLSVAFANRIVDIENVDQTETITLLLHEQRVLQASMQSFTRLAKLSLANFL